MRAVTPSSILFWCSAMVFDKTLYARLNELNASFQEYGTEDAYNEALCKHAVDVTISMLNKTRNQIRDASDFELEFCIQYLYRIDLIYNKICLKSPNDAQPRKFPELEQAENKITRELNRRKLEKSRRDKSERGFIAMLIDEIC